MPTISPSQTARTTGMTMLLLLIGVVFGLLSTGSRAQDSEIKPDLASGIEGWFIIREYADQMHAPADRNSTVSPPQFEAVSIIMRFKGQILSAGEAHKLGTDTLRSAMEDTITRARNSTQVRTLPFDMIESIGRKSTLQVDFADEFIPLLGDTFADTAARIRPGIDGIAVRRGTRWKMAYPNRMQTYGQAERPDRTLIRLLRELGLPPREPGELRRLEDIEFYRFEVLSLAQTESDSMPHESFRGARLVPDNLEIGTLADQIGRDASSSLKERLGSDPERIVGEIDDAERLIALGLFGDYNYVQDKFKPLVGTSADQLLAAWALARSANREGMESRSERLRNLTVLNLIFERLAIVDAVEERPLEDPKSCALAVIASLEAKDAARTLGQPHQKIPLAVEARNRLPLQLKEDDASISSTTLALRLLAGIRLERSEPGTIDPESIETLTETIRTRVGAENAIGILAWLLMCETVESDIAATGENGSNDPLAHEKFRGLLDAVISNQIGHRDSLVAPTAPIPDLRGGFVVGNTDRITATASSLRPFLALAVFRNSEMSQGGRPSESLEESYRLGLRFVRQLQIDEELALRGPRPQRALGNIKRAPWSNEASLADAAIAVLISTERPSEPVEK